jgi:hypothetical protein
MTAMETAYVMLIHINVFAKKVSQAKIAVRNHVPIIAEVKIEDIVIKVSVCVKMDSPGLVAITRPVLIHALIMVNALKVNANAKSVSKALTVQYPYALMTVQVEAYAPEHQITNALVMKVSQESIAARKNALMTAVTEDFVMATRESAGAKKDSLEMIVARKLVIMIATEMDNALMANATVKTTSKENFVKRDYVPITALIVVVALLADAFVIKDSMDYPVNTKTVLIIVIIMENVIKVNATATLVGLVKIAKLKIALRTALTMENASMESAFVIKASKAILAQILIVPIIVQEMVCVSLDNACASMDFQEKNAINKIAPITVVTMEFV